MELFANNTFEQLLQRNGETPHLPSLTCCCGDDDCVRFKSVDRAFRSMENDARLAAEIGHALLQKQETCAREAAERKRYEQELLQMYDEMERANSAMKSRTNKLEWECDNAQKTIDMLQSELQVAQENSAQLASKLETFTHDLKKLAHCEKVIAAKSEVEEELCCQVEDLKHELAIVRKSEGVLRAKHKRLRLKYESLQATHETLSRQHDEDVSRCLAEKDTSDPIKSLQCRKLQYDMLKISSAYDRLQSTPTVGLYVYTDAPTLSDCPSPPLSSTDPVTDHGQSSCLSEIDDTDPANPYTMLQSMSSQSFESLCATDTRVLNRQLKRAFDMNEVSSLSNSIINRILMDVAQYSHQLTWVRNTPEKLQENNLRSFFALVDTVQNLLQEIGTLRLTLNDFQVDYVNRMERLTQQVANNVPGNDHQTRSWISYLWSGRTNNATTT